ncbi:hypothetical protein F2Q68_00016443 [Brassica cretica]|uniref:Uncharacterized protein n=1 Tax=Brassica cretica TaxID=69181 RepID=A0A8S9HF44_BRACR|nr:hypothetical protein F2Q68_00016443 [Brassica cretica]
MANPYEEDREMKDLKDDIDMFGFVADADCGRKYFTCKNFEEEVQMLRKCVDVMAAEIAELKYKLTRPNPTSP